MSGYVRVNDLCRLCSRVCRLTATLIGLTVAFFFSRTKSPRYRRPAYLVILLFLIFKFLIWDHWLSTPRPVANGNTCLDKALAGFSSSIHHGDATVFYHGQFSQKAFAPFVGNGLIGVSVDEAGVWLARNGSYDRRIPFSILLSFAADGQSLYASATVVDFREAVVHRIFVSSSREERQCWWLQQSVFVQRSAADLIIQEIVVTNKADEPVRIGVDRGHINPWRTAEVQTKIFTESDHRIGDSDSYTVLTGVVDDSEDGGPGQTGTTLVAVASVRASAKEIVAEPESRSPLVQLATIVLSQDSPRKLNASESTIVLRRLRKRADKRLVDVVYRPVSDVLRHKHRMAWSELWLTHISIISPSHPNTPGNEEISASAYYMLSATPSFASRVSSHYHHQKHMHRDLSDAERLHCFSGPSTMHTASLWQSASSVADVNDLVQAWIQVLSSYGCQAFLNAGAELTGQAMVLSFAGLRYAKHHLELAINPANVLADVILHNVKYDRHGITLSLHTSFTGGLTRLSVSASHGLAFAPGASNHPYSKSPVLYACPSRCRGEPHVLNSHETVLPVIVTNPATAVLYISTSVADLLHLQGAMAQVDMSHIAVHRPIHSLRPLRRQSRVVWLGICLFIVFFHVFIIVLLVVECRGQKDMDEDMDPFLLKRQQIMNTRTMSA